MWRFIRERLLIIGVFGTLVPIGLATASAASPNLSHAYKSDQTVANGAIVSLDADKADYVVLADADNGSRLIGVAVASEDSLLAVGAEAGKVQIATSGTATALVSTFNGDIKVGDKVGVSPFKGIGMKAPAGSSVIGLAQTDFKKDTDGSDQTVTDRQGKTTKIHVGYVRLALAIGTNNTGTGSSSLNPLQRLAKSATGKTVSTLRVVLSLLIAIIALLTLIALVYGAIYGSILSVGRNPLAKHAIFRTLGSVIGMVVLIAGIAALMVYFLLR